jgi:peptide/nickel transport system permease protein
MRHVEHPRERHRVVRDYPTLLAYLLLGAASVILFNLIADILYAVIDPRIRYS